LTSDSADDSVITTRYRGSKTKVLPSIWKTLKPLNFFTVLDCFGGTGSVSHFLKRKGKLVAFNDHLKFNHIVGRALIENTNQKLTENDLKLILRQKEYDEFPHLIEENFKNIYYTDEENIWLDRIISNIYELLPVAGYKRDMAFWCLFQSCITKRPFSLFHRKNLNLRLRDVKRSFGNKTTWDTHFEIHYRNFVNELNSYVFDSGFPCKALNMDIMEIPSNPTKIFSQNMIGTISILDHFDLVYIDPPYIPQTGENIIYRDLYHFLEGITNYKDWKSHIDYQSKHRRLIPEYNVWNDKKKVIDAFYSLIKKFKDSIIMISHRSDGLPSIEQIRSMLEEFKNNVIVKDDLVHKYALSHKTSREVIFLAM
jgi:adenine-specific DNA methylase